MGPETMAELDPQALRAPAAPPPQPELLAQMRRVFLGVTGLACLLAAGLLATLSPPQARSGTFAVLNAALALTAVGLVQLPTRWLGVALTAQMCAVTAGLAATAVGMGWGLAAPGLPIPGLLVCLLCVAVDWRAGSLLAAVAALAVGAAAVGTPQPALPAPPGAVAQIGTHLIGIAAGLAGGLFISRVIARYRRAAHERQERFRRLLGLAADAYWEIDHEYRLVAAGTDGEAQALSHGRGLGRRPWEMLNFSCDAETLDLLQADLDTRAPFRDLPLHWAFDGGPARSYLVSGEPRFDERGIFTGYWGVARDITDMQAAEEALAATETRYQELFSRIPTPLVLHRNGRVIDANPSAVGLFGHASLQAMQGSDLLTSYESGDSRERARRRMEMLQSQPPGTALPVTDFRLLVQGRQVSVRATGVSVEAQGGPAVLSIFVDDTERLAAEEAVRRSEAMLSHLVATSPDLITLTDLASGKYAMVNRSFEQTTGWTAAEAVGRSSLDLGVWACTQEREDFAARIRAQGSVTDLATQFITKSGAAVSMIVSAARFVMDRREYVVINARDVTEKERERLEREAILANASIGIAVTRQQRFVLANRHFEQIYGWGQGDLVGQPGSVVWPSDADYAQVGALAAPALARGEAVEFERAGRRRDGSTFVARVRGHAIDPARPRDAGTVWIVEDVTERREFEQALARARDDAEAANRAKSAFLANTSHELRTPLNGMIGLARLARDEGVAEERRRQYLDQIAESAQSLAGIISDILDLSKIEAGKLVVESTVFDLHTELKTLQRTYTTLAAARQLELRLDIAPDLGGMVRGDPLRLRQILSNFLVNAIKFTPRGWICLRARRLPAPLGNTVRLEVQDTGPGIAAATREKLFRPFTQADQSTTRRFGGTGLGLSICRELAGLMGGSVGVESTPGEGCVFWAELPLLLSDVAPAPLPAPVAGTLEHRRVLIAEDNAVNMMIAVALLERWGVEVTQAPDGREAVDAVQRAAARGHAFDAVLMDVQMPVMSGHEATRALRLTEAGRTLPIIALTAAALVTEREEALRAGMNDFLTKPIDADKLRSTLARWCAHPPSPAEDDPLRDPSA
ncbi:MAG: PAS domain S-box protein [Rubrivivax sp.]|nr:PAS domain S-box protein [Rubrivivax sp.]